ncbi:ATPase AAA [Chitinispirillum alkaliphilum]|nr:ATPase AAA [Chitinispirillum alkaliphilum]
MSGEIGKEDFSALLRGFEDPSPSYPLSRDYREGQWMVINEDVNEALKKGMHAKIVEKNADTNTVTVECFDKESRSYRQCEFNVFDKTDRFSVYNNKIVKSAGTENHRSGIDMTFSAPKSVSVLALSDPRLEAAFNEAVEKTLSNIESDLLNTRTRKQSGTKDIEVVQADKMLYAKFQHKTSREIDPQLHAHCLLFNMTKAPDGSYSTVHNDSLYTNKMFVGQNFRNNLAQEIKNLGYDINVTDRKQGFFEVSGVDNDIIASFSKRSEQVREEAERLKQIRYCDLSEKELLPLAQKMCIREKSSESYHKTVTAKIGELSKSERKLYGNCSEAEILSIATLGSRKLKTNVTEADIINQAEQTLAQHGTTLLQLQEKAQTVYNSTGNEKRDSIPVDQLVKRSLEDVTEMQAGFDKHTLL